MAQKLVRRVEMVAVELQSSATALNEKIESVSSLANVSLPFAVSSPISLCSILSSTFELFYC